ncbi:multiple sugar transport system permease protein [Rhizobium sp. SG_E_25_P2]|uniref:carbohydrate ABC transporter permease n=1 Tax=Rhizobium sp. SG_E_25_P2 TaxID=2879942 RepID=UPI0024755454|nr:sugar ABC transporter permease [Rhizobium sp. SG_E_25_P2]MDH6266126.1 multiple sugar transport system permease protein [Rhizobium sp. SG_E_25_P2]
MASTKSPQAFKDDRRVIIFALLAPVLAFFIVFNTIPTLWLLGLSFHKFSLLNGTPPEYFGFRNFQDIFRNKNGIWGDLGRTFLFVGVGVGIQTLLGILLGFLFWGSKSMPGRRLALTLLFTPMVLTPVATGTFFRFIYDPTFGVLNALVGWMSPTGTIDFLGNPQIAFWAVLAVDCWMWTPFMTLMTLAALGSVPKAELEAAEIDRLSWPKRVSLVIWHHGKFILMLGVLLRTIDSFKTLDLVIPMTKGGPGQTTRLVAVELNKQSFESFNMGWSSAYSVLLLLISIAMTSMFIFILNRRRRGR